jgi:tetratricopeptide (TPR) repeat protein
MARNEDEDTSDQGSPGARERGKRFGRGSRSGASRSDNPAARRYRDEDTGGSRARSEGGQSRGGDSGRSRESGGYNSSAGRNSNGPKSRDDRGGSRGGSERSSGGYQGRDENRRGSSERSSGGYKGRDDRGGSRGGSERSSGGYQGRDENRRGSGGRDDRGGSRGGSSGGYKGRDDRGGSRGGSERSSGGYQGRDENRRGSGGRDDRGGSRGGSSGGYKGRDDRGGSRGGSERSSGGYQGRDENRRGSSSRDDRGGSRGRDGSSNRSGSQDRFRQPSEGDKTWISREERWPDGDPADNPILKERNWGSLARKGTRQLPDMPDGWDDTERVGADDKSRRDEAPLTPEEAAEREEKRIARAEAQAIRDINTARLQDEARNAISRAGPTKVAKVPPAHERSQLPGRQRKIEDLAVSMERAFGEIRANRMQRRVREAASAYQDEQFADALRILKPVREGAVEVAEVLELQGLTLYRLGHWRAAAKELELFRETAASCEQNPVLMDAYRALGRWNDVDALWDELREISPDGEAISEGRVVVAGGLADRGQIQDAVRLLEKSHKRPKNPRDHHLRSAYALADLYERAGDAPKARTLFGWIGQNDPEFADVEDRFRAL